MDITFDPREPEDLMTDRDLIETADWSDYYEFLELYQEEFKDGD
jgi:hypothetical protein